MLVFTSQNQIKKQMVKDTYIAPIFLCGCEKSESEHSAQPTTFSFSLILDESSSKNQTEQIFEQMIDPDRTGVLDMKTGKFHSLNDLKKNGGFL